LPEGCTAVQGVTPLRLLSLHPGSLCAQGPVAGARCQGRGQGLQRAASRPGAASWLGTQLGRSLLPLLVVRSQPFLSAAAGAAAAAGPVLPSLSCSYLAT
jgi:hypothetical protein